jgi:hypothetical protein
VDGFTISEPPALRAPVVVLAFSGWSDTGTVTTDAAKHLVNVYGAAEFLSVDPEEYYVFTDTRPMVRLGDDGSRVIDWPRNTAHWVRLPEADHDLVLFVGQEPNLRWRTFGSRLATVLADLSPSLVCTLVARPAAAPHTRPIQVTGSSADQRLATKFGLGRSLYQGPTGIIGVVHDELRRRDAALISLAAAVPHYLNVEENPPASIALLRALEPVLGFVPPLDELEGEAGRFLQRVEEASRGDDQIANYVRTLEESYNEAAGQQEPEAGPLPSADDILRDVEDFLRGGNQS